MTSHGSLKSDRLGPSSQTARKPARPGVTPGRHATGSRTDACMNGPTGRLMTRHHPPKRERGSSLHRRYRRSRPDGRAHVMDAECGRRAHPRQDTKRQQPCDSRLAASAIAAAGDRAAALVAFGCNGTAAFVPAPCPGRGCPAAMGGIGAGAIARCGIGPVMLRSAPAMAVPAMGGGLILPGGMVLVPALIFLLAGHIDPPCNADIPAVETDAPTKRIGTTVPVQECSRIPAAGRARRYPCAARRHQAGQARRNAACQAGRPPFRNGTQVRALAPGGNCPTATSGPDARLFPAASPAASEGMPPGHMHRHASAQGQGPALQPGRDGRNLADSAGRGWRRCRNAEQWPVPLVAWGQDRSPPWAQDCPRSRCPRRFRTATGDVNAG